MFPWLPNVIMEALPIQEKDVHLRQCHVTFLYRKLQCNGSDVCSWPDKSGMRGVAKARPGLHCSQLDRADNVAHVDRLSQY